MASAGSEALGPARWTLGGGLRCLSRGHRTQEGVALGRAPPSVVFSRALEAARLGKMSTRFFSLWFKPGLRGGGGQVSGPQASGPTHGPITTLAVMLTEVSVLLGDRVWGASPGSLHRDCGPSSSSGSPAPSRTPQAFLGATGSAPRPSPGLPLGSGLGHKTQADKTVSNAGLSPGG